MICRATMENARAVAGLAVKMWDENTIEEMTAEFEMIIEDKDAAVFLYYDGGKAIGFAQCQLRHDYVEGTETSPVGYLEGIFVEEDYRGKGYAKKLLSVCENWAKDMGCSEFASDCELDNVGSLRFHMAMGFEEVNRVICFKKNI